MLGGLERGLVATECLLWLLALPLTVPYAAMAALLLWQLRSTALMWRVMRGKQQLAPLRQRLLAWRRHISSAQRTEHGGCTRDGTHRSGGSGGGGGGSQAAVPLVGPPVAASMASFACSPGSGLKQLSGSMLLFMPLLLLLPTTAWFYGFTLLLHAAASAPRAAAQLARQLVAYSPVGAALQHLLHSHSIDGSSTGGDGDCGSSRGRGKAMDAGSMSLSGGGGSGSTDFEPLEVRFASLAALPPWAQQAAQQTAYLQAARRHGSPWHAAWGAAAQAWGECSFSHASSVPAALLAALCGRPLFLDWPWQGVLPLPHSTL